MKLISFITIYILFALTSCQKEKTTNISIAGVQIRIENASIYNFTSIKVNSSMDYNYGNIDSGQKSIYIEHEMAYQYAYIALDINGKQFIIQPVDYIGESPLENGHYTYRIDASIDDTDLYGRLSLSFIED